MDIITTGFYFIAIHQIFMRQSPLMGQLRLRRLSANRKVSGSIWIPQLHAEPSSSKIPNPKLLPVAFPLACESLCVNGWAQKYHGALG